MYYNGLGVEKNSGIALQWYTKSAKQRKSDAQHEIDEWDFDWSGSFDDPQDCIQARIRSQNSTNKIENADAQLYFGYLHSHGVDVEKKNSVALQSSTKSANQGDFDAQNHAGIRYRDGVNVAQDYKVAMRLFQEAVDNDENAHAQYNIGYMDYNGLSVKKTTG